MRSEEIINERAEPEFLDFILDDEWMAAYRRMGHKKGELVRLEIGLGDLVLQQTPVHLNDLYDTEIAKCYDVYSRAPLAFTPELEWSFPKSIGAYDYCVVKYGDGEKVDKSRLQRTPYGATTLYWIDYTIENWRALKERLAVPGQPA